jgi:hypothetical protein
MSNMRPMEDGDAVAHPNSPARIAVTQDVSGRQVTVNPDGSVTYPDRLRLWLLRSGKQVLRSDQPNLDSSSATSLLVGAGIPIAHTQLSFDEHEPRCRLL